MGIRILVGVADGSKSAAALYDSVTDTMFGPLIEAACADDATERAEAFIAYVWRVANVDARRLSDGDMNDAWAGFVRDEYLDGVGALPVTP